MTKDYIPFLSLKTSNAPWAEQLVEAATRVINSGWYLRGVETKNLEEELLQNCGLTNNEGCAIGVSNGLDAIRLIFRGYMELGILSPGDEVLVPANTYIASILPITEFGLTPVLIEPDMSTFGIDWEKARDNVTTKTKALLTVHLYGHPSWHFEIANELRSKGIVLIEDNAQAIGASITNSDGIEYKTGALGDAAAFSFYPTKNIGALGDAGAVVTKDSRLGSAIRALANYGTDRRYHNIYKGYNCRIDELQAAFLRIKLKHLSEISSHRQEIASAYLGNIWHPLVILPLSNGNAKSVWHQFTIMSPKRDDLIKWLEDNGIATDIHYATPPHKQPCYKDKLKGEYPLTEKIANSILSLPIADISINQALQIAEIINNWPQKK